MLTRSAHSAVARLVARGLPLASAGRPRHDTPDDRALIDRAQHGDRAAQSALVVRYQARVTRYVLAICGEPGDVDDIVQEVFMCALRALPRFRGDAPIATWLHTIAANRVRHHWLSRSRRKRREDTAATLAADDVEDPEHLVIARQQQEHLQAAFVQLPEKLRAAFHMRVIEGVSLDEASAALGAPISTISYRASRAGRLLHAVLDVEGR